MIDGVLTCDAGRLGLLFGSFGYGMIAFGFNSVG